MPFKPGQSGNPSGRPKVDPEVRTLCEKFTPDAIRTLAEIMQNKQAQASARVTAATAILKKTLPDLSAVDHSGDVQTPFVILAPQPSDSTEEWERKNAPPSIN